MPSSRGDGEDLGEVFPGVDGIPYRRRPGESVLLYKESDPEYRRPVVRKVMHVGVFDLSDEAQRAEYERVMSGLVDSANKTLSFERCEYDPKLHKYIALVRWVEKWMEAPPRAASTTYKGEAAHGKTK